MTVNEINQRIATANKNAKKLNDTRQMEIGRKEALLKQRDEAIAAYKAKYGVVLTPENIEQELEAVQAQKMKEVAEVEQLISLITSGEYAEAQALSNKIKGIEEPVVEEVDVVEEVVGEVEAPVVGDLDLELDIDVELPVMAPVAEPEVTPVKVVAPKGILEEGTKKPKAKNTVKSTDIFDLGDLPTPPSISLDAFDDMDLDMPTPVEEKKSNFGSILNGSEFNPTGGAL